MSQANLDVLEYLTEDGHNPFREWLETLHDREARSRIYFGRQGNMIVVLLSGGDKRTQDRDIEFAQFRWQDYLRRST